MAYWDTSCLLKLYAPEADSSTFRTYVMNGMSITTAEVSRLELFAALRRKESIGDLRTGGTTQAITAYDADVTSGRIVVFSLNATVRSLFETVIEDCYRTTPPVQVRTLDAIHLATARGQGERELVATDRRLREAAIVLGFKLYPS